MTKENILKDYKHYCILAEGDFNERTFDFELKAKKLEDGGSTHVGKMTQERIDLIKSDAGRHKKDLEEKYPWLLENPILPITVDKPEDLRLIPKPKKKKRVK